MLDLVVLVRVDNRTYLYLGYAPTVTAIVNFTNTVISPTQTKLIAEAGPMQINLTFLNPIEPKDWVKQSIPFSYMSLTAKSLDGAAHAMQVYSDLSGEWLSGDTRTPGQVQGQVTFSGAHVKANSVTGVIYYAIYHRPELGVLYHAMKLEGELKGDLLGDPNVTANNAEDSVSRDSFRLNGVLPMPYSINFTVNPNSTVFAISRDLGTIQARQNPVIWAIGYNTDPVINYTDLSGAPQRRRLFYKIQYADVVDSSSESLIIDFINDFFNASSRAQELDQKILQDAAHISGSLGDLVSLATAQVYGSIHLTIATDTNGYFNKSDAMAFMRNIGGSKPDRVNAVETLYSAFPAFMYIDPELGGLLLEPLFRLQASPKYTNLYAAPDLGMNYLDVTVTNSAHSQGVEHSGNMVIMTYAHARASGDVSLISRYYDLLTTWANYLTSTTLLTLDQSSADGLSTDNQSNLAIKGIIAIEAMSRMSSIAGHDADADKYSNITARLYAQWKILALGDDKHLLATYGLWDSWTIGYNLFADAWLNTSVVESSVYDGQSNFLNNLSLSSNFSHVGLPVDNLNLDWNTNLPISSWNLFAAAMTPNQDPRTNIISNVHFREAYPYRRYEPARGHYIGPTIVGSPSPAQGAMYAPLALKASVNLTIASPTTTGTSSESKPRTGVPVITRGVIGGVTASVLAIGATVLVVLWRRRRQSHRRTSVTVTPFNPTWSTLTEVAPPGAGPQTDSQQQLVHRPSSPEDPPLPLQHVASVPVGLSSKELARLRSLASRSRSQPADGRPPDPPLIATTDGGELEGGAAAATYPSSESRRLRLENNILRDEIQQLHAERNELPPSYASEAA